MENSTKDLIPLTIGSSKINSQMQPGSRLGSHNPLAQLENEFKDVLLNPKQDQEADYYSSLARSHSISVTDTTTTTLYSEDYANFYTLLCEEDLDKLRGIAEKLKSTEHLAHCAQVYIDGRKEIVKLIWRRLCQRINVKYACEMDYEEDVKGKIQWWIQVDNIFLGHVFMKEKTFYEQIFGELGAPDHVHGYVLIIQETAINLFEFADKLMHSPQFPKTLEILLPLYQELLDLKPAVDLLLSKDFDLANKLLSQIAQQTAQILSSSESQVLHEASGVPTPGGGIHPMTEYVMRYIDLISNHSSSLSDLMNLEAFKNLGTSMRGNSGNIDRKSNLLSLHATQVIKSLLQNLKNKSSVYKNEPLDHFFMMNNVHHVVQKIKGSKRMQEFIDKDFQTQLSVKVERSMFYYLKTSWYKVFECLDTEKSKSLALSRKFGNFTKPAKRKLNTFNHTFEEILQAQAEWVVQHQELRKKLQQSIWHKLVSEYTLFMEEFGCKIEKGKQPDRYIKFTVEDITQKVLNLFQC